MSDMIGGLFETVGSILGFGKKPEMPSIPAAKIPAAPASAIKQDTGAQVVLGTADTKNQRVSGRTRKSATGGSGDVLGGLGRSGLNI